MDEKKKEQMICPFMTAGLAGGRIVRLDKDGKLQDLLYVTCYPERCGAREMCKR